ncbi:hypothetical protein [Streptomyces alkaliterrae]|uniref:Uncharacterized protein n=1 Tax=Streptomyces alkaliterrae TaxID=2213162 RepID=A0A5P0YZL8_9ACTN|nr:hypothetical protein [Streptomyces alkaliterrae]MBB1256843.1 hypothetical protein [Streptomyces alkaliterrae]MBB1262365.1 hypothetical protein [Streptomyces alkaliterrae]MQS05162.1 hypothetical protein [Streptomyces alkaliterrae]
MNQAARRIGRTLALVLPVVLVLSGTLAVAQVPWATAPTESQVLASAADEAANKPARPGGSPAPHEALRDRLITELQQEDPAVALTSLQRAVDRKPSLAEHCMDIARALGKAAVLKYGAERAQRFSRPVCDTSFAAGVAATR